MATGNTTAKVTLLQGTVLSALRRQYSAEGRRTPTWQPTARGRPGCCGIWKPAGVPFQERDAYTYATTPKGTERFARSSPWPWPPASRWTTSATPGCLSRSAAPCASRGQAQINPMDVVLALAEDVRSHGGTIVSGVRVRNVSGTGPSTVETDHGTVHADSVVLATGTPILNRGLYFAKLKPNRSYAAALELPGDAVPPDGMYLSVEQPVRSLRDYPTDGRRLLLVGGNGHPVGGARSEQAHLDELLAWAASHFPDATVTHTWSAQDYQATNLMPFFGKLPRGRGRIYFATGYNKWGMTNAVAASLGIAADILGGHLPWANTIHRRVTSPPGAASAVALNAEWPPRSPRTGRRPASKDCPRRRAPRPQRARGPWFCTGANPSQRQPWTEPRAACLPSAPTSAGYSTGTTTKNPGTARCTAPGSAARERSSRDRPRTIFLRPSEPPGLTPLRGQCRAASAVSAVRGRRPQRGRSPQAILSVP